MTAVCRKKPLFTTHNVLNTLTDYTKHLLEVACMALIFCIIWLSVLGTVSADNPQ